MAGLAATAIFIWLACRAAVPPLQMNLRWIAVLAVVLLASLIGCGYRLYKQTRFS